ncbi:GlcD FAD FMN-containing dehydrogenase [Pyrenophora tritici-repentis]|uniref:FAD binding domain containing protein n=2 Tax=Pyrenophora tritici-repentis TaxID=45151 RepID=A0A2W1H5Y8_9PLEO|nr:uncharacterized protein PTRG_01888 [Pyrenophora tritici-repentis Pt-1C-BFP]KAA8626590.1 GlcD FAD-FMN-containing dehydrogenase [Pyrenophora tritici-repentis]EDU41326.1 conserved hypothetical protein [Pyrenophora tritici-repentis Pt-1C-BFP]KAF7455021.1 GlcD FAD-FMN-containing dehydrogenase [Pyrenophora tritici-repentis]KAF7578172.1 GlcD, FAD-FMN-containing dehydrogenase [Pyrenophora tritici-repentis]KAG9388777.1 GlcD FAD-FMN-containing dehydrogenase [Pyrenophora tritici-repentis]
MLVRTIVTGLLCIIRCSSAFEQKDLKHAVSALSAQLSDEATITFPGGAEWDILQLRASSPRVSPHYSVIVQVATESDVQATVTLANRFNIPFLAISGAHGWTKSLNKLPYGIQINMRKLNTTTLSQDGKTAMVGGGTLQYEITRALFAKGKYAVTGLSECVSVAGPLLGGGHSLLQGQYGYSLDGLVSARLVIASGKIVEASRTRNADLFWALQGAGHNFGIVTSLEVKTHDIPSNWTVYSLIYPAEKIESLFSLLNDFEGPSMKRPAKLALTGVFAKLPGVDPVNPVVAYTVAYEGSQAEAEPYAAYFKALGPISITVSTNVNYVELYTVTGNNIDSHVCAKNENIAGAGVTLPTWDIEGLRKAFTVFANVTADPRFSTAIILLENYGMQGVRAVDPASTALALEERENPILASPVLWWKGDDEQTNKDAYAYTRAIRDALYTGLDKSDGKRHCYVNYANGEEPKAELYGYDARLAKLTKLKNDWDPKNSFKYYNPI